MFILILGPTLLKLLLPCSPYPPHFATVASSPSQKRSRQNLSAPLWLDAWIWPPCAFPLKKKKKRQQHRKTPNTPPMTHKGHNKLQFLGIMAWQLLLKKLAVVPSPCAFSAFSLRIWLWFFSEEPIPIPHLPPPGKKLRPSLKILLQLWLRCWSERKVGPQHPGASAQGRTKTPVSGSDKKMENTVFALESFYI